MCINLMVSQLRNNISAFSKSPPCVALLLIKTWWNICIHVDKVWRFYHLESQPLRILSPDPSGSCRWFWLLVTTVKGDFSFCTNLQATLDQVEGHHCCVCDAAAQDTPKATQGIVLSGAEFAALCDRREGGGHTERMQHARSRAAQDKNQHHSRAA